MKNNMNIIKQVATGVLGIVLLTGIFITSLEKRELSRTINILQNKIQVYDSLINANTPKVDLKSTGNNSPAVVGQNVTITYDNEVDFGEHDTVEYWYTDYPDTKFNYISYSLDNTIILPDTFRKDWSGLVKEINGQEYFLCTDGYIRMIRDHVTYIVYDQDNIPIHENNIW